MVRNIPKRGNFLKVLQPDKITFKVLNPKIIIIINTVNFIFIIGGFHAAVLHNINAIINIRILLV